MTIDHRERLLRDEHARSHAHLKRYHEKNPGILSDPDTFMTAHGMMTDEQSRDLEATGLYDPEGFRKQSGGRGPTASEIHDKHLEARAHRVKGVRQASELIEHVHRRLVPPRNKDGQFTKR